jgi:hypothetical protein
VFSLFTPEGERRWVEGWLPEYLYRPAEGIAAGLVFRTRVDGEETLWLVARFDPRRHEVEYVRIVPASRMGTVLVRCRRAGRATQVSVRYVLTALSAEGSARLADLASGGFAAMIAGWEDRLTRLLADPTTSLIGQMP